MYIVIFVGSLSMYMCVCILSHFGLLVAPRTVAHQAPLSMKFPRQEYWSKLTFPSLGDLPDPGILGGRLFTNCIIWEAHKSLSLSLSPFQSL